jgi:hypothetical protein
VIDTSPAITNFHIENENKSEARKSVMKPLRAWFILGVQTEVLWYEFNYILFATSKHFLALLPKVFLKRWMTSTTIKQDILMSEHDGFLQV